MVNYSFNKIRYDKLIPVVLPYSHQPGRFLGGRHDVHGGDPVTCGGPELSDAVQRPHSEVTSGSSVKKGIIRDTHPLDAV